jgi:hypothetical protein
MQRTSTRRTKSLSFISRRATVLDVWGDRWSIVERRPTDYKFSICLGYPDTSNPLDRRGKAKFIVTEPFARHLHAHTRRPHSLPLPIGRKALRRIRVQLGIDHRAWTDARLYWWIDRIDDLATLSATQFATKHGAHPWTRSGTLSTTLIWGMRAILLGPGLVNPTGQYRKLYRP